MQQPRQTTSWPLVVQHFEDLVTDRSWRLEPMLALVQFLAGSRYAKTLFPGTAGEILLIGRAPNFMPGDNELQVSFDGEANRFTFTYNERAGSPKPWTRDCEAPEWRAVLERLFHKRLNWFHEG